MPVLCLYYACLLWLKAFELGEQVKVSEVAMQMLEIAPSGPVSESEIQIETF